MPHGTTAVTEKPPCPAVSKGGPRGISGPCRQGSVTMPRRAQGKEAIGESAPATTLAPGTPSIEVTEIRGPITGGSPLARETI